MIGESSNNFRMSNSRAFTRKKKSYEKTGTDDSDWQIVEIRLDEYFGSSEKFFIPHKNILEIKEEPPEELLDAPELPEVYGEDIFVILSVDPFSSYCYWEVTEKTKKEAFEKIKPQILSDTRLFIRLYRQQSNTHCFEQNIDKEFSSGSVYIDYSAPYNLFYGKIGYLKENGDFITLVTSPVPEKISLPLIPEEEHEKGWTEMDLKPIPPIPPSPISFDLLVTEQIEPILTTQKKEISSQKELIYKTIPHTDKEEASQHIYKKETSLYVHKKEITSQKEHIYTKILKTNKEKISLKDRNLPGTVDISWEFLNFTPHIHDLFHDSSEEDTQFFQQRENKPRGELSPDIRILFKNNFIKVPALFRAPEKTDDVHWKILKLPPAIYKSLQERFTEEIPFPFAGRPSS
ncbi:MAG: hypothetical protein BWY64_02800 [bacterium ADurb.Bin363]|nr:MAG: hypothetical protein BWY64_02800 [bacterium ADurb.Bin363]